MAWRSLAFCVACLCAAVFALRLQLPALRSFVVVTLVFSGQALFYVARERPHLWSSRPGVWFMALSLVDVMLIATLATCGLLMAPLAVWIVATLAAVELLRAKPVTWLRLRVSSTILR